jgi:hypothetical protein
MPLAGFNPTIPTSKQPRGHWDWQKVTLLQKRKIENFFSPGPYTISGLIQFYPWIDLTKLIYTKKAQGQRSVNPVYLSILKVCAPTECQDLSHVLAIFPLGILNVVSTTYIKQTSGSRPICKLDPNSQFFNPLKTNGRPLY